MFIIRVDITDLFGTLEIEELIQCIAWKGEVSNTVCYLLHTLANAGGVPVWQVSEVKLYGFGVRHYN